VVAWTTRPLGIHDSIPRPGPSARCRAHPAELLGARLVGGDALSTTLWRLHSKSRLRFFALYNATVLCRVVPPQPQHSACSRGVEQPPDRWEPPTGNAPGCLSTVTLRVSKALATLALQWDFCRHVRLHRHSQAAEFGE